MLKNGEKLRPKPGLLSELGPEPGVLSELGRCAADTGTLPKNMFNIVKLFSIQGATI